MSERAVEYYKEVADRYCVPFEPIEQLLGRAVVLDYAIQLHSIEKEASPRMAETEQAIKPVIDFLGSLATRIACDSDDQLSQLPVNRGKGVLIRHKDLVARDRRLKNFTTLLTHHLVSERIKTGTLSGFTLEALAPDEVHPPALRSLSKGVRSVNNDPDRAFYALLRGRLKQGGRTSTVAAMTQWQQQPLYINNSQIVTALQLHSFKMPNMDESLQDLRLSQQIALAVQEEKAARPILNTQKL